jgi:hypothetical protein
MPKTQAIVLMLAGGANKGPAGSLGHTPTAQRRRDKIAATIIAAPLK